MTCWLCGFITTELATNAPTCKNGPCQICIAVAEVDEEINQAVAALGRLIAKRCDLRSEQNRVHGLMHRLPLELKNYIFELVLPLRDEWGRRETNRTDGTVLPSYLASVCRGWRDVAWSNPIFWSTMHIAVATSNSTSSRINFVHDWIIRSRTLPLTSHIHVVGGRKSLECSRKVLAPVLDAMGECSNRLQSLSLDIPYPILQAFQPSNFRWHRLTRLQIRLSPQPSAQINQPLPLLNPTASPERIELRCVSFRSLQISWSRLSSAKVESLDIEDLTQLFRHASQMTDCQISLPRHGTRNVNFAMPPIIHPRLKTLRMHRAGWDVGHRLLLSLSLPGLQEFHTNETHLLLCLPGLVQRSSCPLTRLALSYNLDDGSGEIIDDLRPLPGVTDVVLEDVPDEEPALIKELLLEGHFPDLRHLSIRPKPFLLLWNAGVVPLLLDCKRPQPDGPNNGRLDKLLVVDQEKGPKFDWKWNSDLGKQLKALGISLREDGFEFL